MSTLELKEKRGFSNAWGIVSNKDMKALRERVQELVGFSQPAFYNRMRGETGHNDGDMEKIEQAFAEFGYINIWD